MGFTPINFQRLAKFNSQSSCEFIELYEGAVKSEIVAHEMQPKRQTIAPSSFKCARSTWFRLRGVEPDIIRNPDISLRFRADIGIACHEMIQKRLIDVLGDKWLSVESRLKSLDKYEFSVTSNGYETQVEIKSPPVRFAVDGLIEWKGIPTLLEIKTAEYSSFTELVNIRPQHIDQIMFYATLLDVSKVLVMYVDRTHGDIKCYERDITSLDKKEIWDRVKYVQDMVEANLAPDRLDYNDPGCPSTQCPYYQKCKQWG